jgi:hypothetical protein
MAAGLVSALIAVNFLKHPALLGAVYGIAIVLCLVLFAGIRTPLRIVTFILACSAAFPLSIFGAIVLKFGRPQGMDSSLFNLFVGGCIGAFVVLLFGMLLFGPEKMRGQSLGVAFLCSFGGGILGLLGGALNLALGEHRSGDRGSYLGPWVFIIWQCGVALMLGLLLAWGERQSESGNQETRK